MNTWPILPRMIDTKDTMHFKTLQYMAKHSCMCAMILNGWSHSKICTKMYVFWISYSTCVQWLGWCGTMGYSPIQQKNRPLTTEIAVLHLERMAHRNFNFKGKTSKMAHTIVCPPLLLWCVLLYMWISVCLCTRVTVCYKKIIWFKMDWLMHVYNIFIGDHICSRSLMVILDCIFLVSRWQIML